MFIKKIIKAFMVCLLTAYLCSVSSFAVNAEEPEEATEPQYQSVVKSYIYTWKSWDPYTEYNKRSYTYCLIADNGTFQYSTIEQVGGTGTTIFYKKTLHYSNEISTE